MGSGFKVVKFPRWPGGVEWVASRRVTAAKRGWVRHVWHPPAAPLCNNVALTARLAPAARQNGLLSWRRSRALTFTPPSECDQLSPSKTTSGLYSSLEAASYGCTQWRAYGEKWVGSLLNKQNFLDIFLIYSFSLHIVISFYLKRSSACWTSGKLYPEVKTIETGKHECKLELYEPNSFDFSPHIHWVKIPKKTFG